MGKYIVRRLLQMIPVILGSTFLIYAMVFALPGDPAQGRCGERPCNPAYIAAFNEEFNLDEPLLIQYALYLGQALPGRSGHQLLRELGGCTSWPSATRPR